MKVMFFGLFLVSVISLLVAFISFRQIGSPLVIVDADLLNEDVCSGVLRYHTDLQTNKVPSVIAVYRSVWSEELQTTVITEDKPRFAVMTEKVISERTSEYCLSYLPPGKYQLRIAVQSFGSEVSAVSLPFQVPEMCE